MHYSNMKILILLSVIYYGASSLYTQSDLVHQFSVKTSDGLIIAGEIDYPQVKQNGELILLIAGNGPHTRDMQTSGVAVFKILADKLLKKGYLVVRFDKRGFGKSSGSYTDSETDYTTNDLKNDVQKVIDYVKKKEKIKSDKIGIIGHSEGAIIAAMLAADYPDLGWSILIAPAAISGKEIVIGQKRRNQKRMGITEDLSVQICQVLDEYFEFVKDGYQSDSLYYAIGRRFLLAHGLDKDDSRINHTFIDQLIDAYKSKWYQYFFKLNPSDYLEKIKSPLLAIYGAEDNQVTVEENLIPLYQALKRSKNKQFQLTILPDEDHFFLRFHGERLEKHKFEQMEISNQLVRTIYNFIDLKNN
ncbi:MAG: alpha/beta fold hydrolase [Calditrichaeota bacterium]|nr:alpha/beta fold hydrolase [Calditrichota bacterium]